MSLTLYHGRLDATVSEVVDAGDLLPHFELAALAVLEGEERPGEEPAVRRRFRFEGIRTREHRGALLLDPGELERASSAGLLGGGDEVFLSTVWTTSSSRTTVAWTRSTPTCAIPRRSGSPTGWPRRTACS